MTDEEPEFIEPDHVQIAIFHGWRAAWIVEQITASEVTLNSFARLRESNEKGGSVVHLNMCVEQWTRHKAQLQGWYMEEKELERQAMLQYEHERRGRI